jgi:hypothetical protein
MEPSMTPMNLFRELKQRANLAFRILCGFDGCLEAHAEREMRAAGYFDGDEMDGLMAQGVIDMVRVFSLQGHSGMSSSFALQLFNDVARFKPIGPLTGADSEWVDVTAMSGRPMWQNNRCGHVFKAGDGQAYDIDAVIFEEPSGARFTGHLSRQFITFPYTPRSVVVQIADEATDEDRRIAAARAWASPA